VKTIEEILAFNVYRLRKSEGLSQGELASKAKVSLHTVFRIEAKKAGTKTSSVEAIAKALGVTKEDLYARPTTDLGELGRRALDTKPEPPKLSPDEAKEFLLSTIQAGAEALFNENKALRAEIEALKSQLNSRNHLMDAFEKAEPHRREMALKVLALSDEKVEAVLAGLRRSHPKSKSGNP
jgi:transcriptional regulator with XRE-family HTH domain